MLFSSSEVAEYINTAFEPAWESVRAAPLVTIDFGNGHVVKRTLQGNIATYVCGSDGTVYDVLPGIYTPDVYRKQLEALKAMADSLRRATGTREDATAAERMRANWTLASRLREYHTLSEAKLTAPAFTRLTTPQFQNFGGGFGISPPGFGGVGGMGGFGGFGGQPQPALTQMEAIARTGGGIKGGGFPAPGGNFGGVGLSPAGFGGGGFGGFGGIQGMTFSGIEGPVARVIAGASGPVVPFTVATGRLADRPELKLDTEVNERIRRKAVHAELARLGNVQPADIKKWLFREVLHADLDDPKLGLGNLLDSNYPFAEEDKAAERKK